MRIDCADKKAHHADALKPGLMPFFPSRIIMAGASGVGKGGAAKNLMLTAVPPYDKIVILHYDPNGTSEWDDVDPHKIMTVDEFPSEASELFDRDEKNALVIDELDFTAMSRPNRGKMDRLFNYMCSHHSITCYCLQQNLTSIPPTIRRSATHMVLWRTPDRNAMKYISRLTGHDLEQLFKQFCKTKFDSIMIDFSMDGPELRLNLFTPITDDAHFFLFSYTICQRCMTCRQLIRKVTQ